MCRRDNTKLLYIANARLPTEKAHGYQIVKMCEAFAANDVEVLLFHPFRFQKNPKLARQSVFRYYNVPAIFQVRTLSDWPVARFERFFPNGTFKLVFFAHALLWGLYAAWRARREGADLYYTRNGAVAYWLVRLGLPTAYEAHGVPKRGRRWFLQRIAQAPSLQLVVALTSFIEQQFGEMGFPTERLTVLPDAVDPSLFEGGPGKAECRQRLGLPLDRPIIGYIGRFHTMDMEKGIPELVQAMKYLLAEFPDKPPLLLCVGGPMDRVPAYEAIAREHGVPLEHLHFIDRVPNTEVPYWMRACDVCTIPWPWNEFSAYYTSPMKLFEYMAAGVPIVASDLPSLREVLCDGENAVLVSPGDPRALAGGIQRVLEDQALATHISTRTQRDVKQYTWNTRAQHILEFIDTPKA